MAKVDLSMLDLEWFFEKEEDEEEKNKGNFVCLQLQPTSHAHNFLWPVKVNFYAIIFDLSERGVYLCTVSVQYHNRRFFVEVF